VGGLPWTGPASWAPGPFALPGTHPAAGMWPGVGAATYQLPLYPWPPGPMAYRPMDQRGLGGQSKIKGSGNGMVPRQAGPVQVGEQAVLASVAAGAMVESERIARAKSLLQGTDDVARHLQASQLLAANRLAHQRLSDQSARAGAGVSGNHGSFCADSDKVPYLMATGYLDTRGLLQQKPVASRDALAFE
ncbi:unnamed protein product, partial [Polarella glacialis]